MASRPVIPRTRTVDLRGFHACYPSCWCILYGTHRVEPVLACGASPEGFAVTTGSSAVGWTGAGVGASGFAVG